jgi:hypothetical protein
LITRISEVPLEPTALLALVAEVSLETTTIFSLAIVSEVSLESASILAISSLTIVKPTLAIPLLATVIATLPVVVTTGAAL